MLAFFLLPTPTTVCSAVIIASLIRRVLTHPFLTKNRHAMPREVWQRFLLVTIRFYLTCTRWPISRTHILVTPGNSLRFHDFGIFRVFYV